MVGTFKGQGGGKSVILNGHIDVVPIAGEWKYPSFGGIVDYSTSKSADTIIKARTPMPL